MPCMGPDLGEARKRGNEIGRLMFFELVNKTRLKTSIALSKYSHKPKNPARGTVGVSDRLGHAPH